jgi:predicted Fe-Mo cluster-binding NifX family protein
VATLREIRPTGVRTAVLVMSTGHGVTLCPLFAKCDGVLLIEPDRSRSYYSNTDGTAQSLSELIRAIGASRLVCGFIGAAERTRLRAAGVDVRLGSCACTIDELVASFSTLPPA